MNEVRLQHYDFLRRKSYLIHDEQKAFLVPEVLQEFSRYEVVEFYSRNRICELSENNLIETELRSLVHKTKELRQKHPEGSNEECICMDMITELIGKLDLADFRKLKIERIVDDIGV